MYKALFTVLHPETNTPLCTKGEIFTYGAIMALIEDTGIDSETFIRI